NINLALQAGSQYLIAVVNTSSSASVREDFTLFGATASGAPSANRVAPQPPAVDRSAMALGEVPTEFRAAQRALQHHVNVMEENRFLYATMGRPRAAWARARQLGGARRSSSVVSPTVGTVNKVYVRRSGSRTCTAVDSIGARTVAVGQHVIVLADTNRTTW